MAQGDKDKRGRNRNNTVSGPPKPSKQNRRQSKTAKTQTAKGIRVTPKGAAPGKGPTPDAKVRQKVLNGQADKRRNQREGQSTDHRNGVDGEVQGPPPRRQRPNGSPPGQPAPQRGQGGGISLGSQEFRALSRPEQIKLERAQGGGPGSRRSNASLSQSAEEGGPQVRPNGTPPGQPAPQPGQAGDNNVGAAQANFDKAQASGNQEFIDAATNRLTNTKFRAGEGDVNSDGGTQAEKAAGAVEPVPTGPPKIGGERREAQPATTPVVGVPGTPQGPPASGDIASQPGQSMNAAGQDQVRATAQAEIASGTMPEPPGQEGADGSFTPDPGMAPQDAANAIQAQTEAAMAEKPEPAMPKSPLGADSPIEQADAGGKLRAGTRHHMRALGFQTSGMDSKTAKSFERQAVRDFDQFGEYPGMDDPHSPPPPIRIGKHSINPMTAQWVTPEGQISVLDRLAPPGAKGPDSLLTIDAVKKGLV